MFRKLAIILAIGLLAFTTACSSSSSSTNAAGAAGTGAGVVATSTPNTCPTTETKKFAKTLFVADAALAGGAFKRWIYDPAKAGKFKKGAKGKTVALVKAVAAGAFVINRLDAAKTNVQNDPALCKLLIEPITKFSSAISGLVGQAKDGVGTINPSDVDSSNSALTDLHNAATKGGNPFTDNTNTNA